MGKRGGKDVKSLCSSMVAYGFSDFLVQRHTIVDLQCTEWIQAMMI